MNQELRNNKVGLVYVVATYIILSYGLYRQALFFSPTKTYVSAVIILVGLIATIWLMIKKQFSVPGLTALGLIYAAYAFFTCLWAASPAVAVEGSVITGAGVTFLLFAPFIKDGWRRIALNYIPLSGAVLYMFGMVNGVGWLHYKDAIQTKMMDSVFQYHNTFGSYELAGAVILLILSLAAKSRLNRGLYILGTATCLLGDLLSYSRWVWMLSAFMLLVVFLVSIYFHRWRTSLFNIVASGIVALLAAPFSLNAISRQSGADFAISLLVLLVGSAVVWGLLSFQVKVQNRAWKVSVFSVIAVVAVIAAALLLSKESSHLTSLANRVHSINFQDTSFKQRFWYYSNALRIWLDNPIFGTGFGTWTIKFQAYQQYPYWSTMTHSVLFEQIDSLGLIGTGLWLSIIVVSIVSAIRVIRRRDDYAFVHLAALVGALSLLLHAIFDFDFNFPVVSFLFFMLLGLSTSGISSQHAEEQPTRRNMWYGIGYTVGGISLVLLAAGLTESQWLLTQSEKLKSTDAKISKLKASVSLAPYNPTPHLQLGVVAFQRYMQSKSSQDLNLAWSNVQTAERKAKWDPSVQQTAAQVAYDLGHLQEAYNWSKLAAKDGKFSTQYQTTFMGIGLWAGVGEYKSHPDDAKSLFQSVVDTYRQFQADAASQKSLPSDLPPEWSFKVDAPAQVYAAAAEYGLGEYQQSIKDLENISSVNRDDNTVGLFELVSMLDEAKMSHQKLTQVPTQIQNSNPLLQAEYKQLVDMGN